MIDEPMPQLTERQPVAHRHRPRTHKTLPARSQHQTLYGSTGWIGSIENPDCLAMRGCGFEYVEQRRDERVDPATKIL